MNAFSEILNDRERTTLRRLALSAVLIVVLSVVVSTQQRNSSDRAGDVRDEQARSYRTVDGSRQAKAIEWQRWQEAAKDLEFFRSRYLYDDKEGGNALRLDLEQIFNRAGLRVSQIGYSYAEMDKGEVKKMVATFGYSGSYQGLKRLLAIIERFPKFLVVEKIDFTNTGAGSGILQVRLTLAGYYGI